MSFEGELADLADVVRQQVAEGIARDVAIKLLAGLVSQVIDRDDYQDMVQSHLKAILGLDADGEANAEMNQRIAAHFHDLLITSEEGN